MTIRYPWPTFTAALRCNLEDIRLDGRPIPSDSIDPEHLRVVLDSDAKWSRFECVVTAAPDEAALEGVDDQVIYLITTSTPTNTRLCLPLTGDPAGGRLVVPRDVVSGVFAVRAEASAIVFGRRRTVGSSRPWTVVLDRREAPVPPGKPPFEVVWIDFLSDGAPPVARENATAHAVMDMTDEPRLLLNSGIEGLRALLHADKAKLERRRLRDILAAQIARHATMVLFRTAVGEIVEYAETGQGPSSALLRQTCEAIAEQMPSVTSVDELYEAIAASQDSPNQNSELWLRVDLATDRLTQASTTLSIAAEQVAHG